MKALFIGLGGIGQRHLRNLLKLRPDVQIAAVRHKGRTFEITDTLTANHDVNIVDKYQIKVYSTLNDALSFYPDFALVTNPTSLHLSTCQELVDYGIPVLVEKPLSATPEGLANLLNSAFKKKVEVAVGYQLRFHPCAKKLKSLIDQNYLGKLFSVQILINSYMPEWHPYENYKDYYVGRKDLGGGVVLTEIHEIDLLHWYMGTPNKLWAVGGKLSSLDLDVEDTVDVLIEYEFNGTKLPVSIHMSYVQPPPSRQFIIRGEKGTLTWEMGNGIIMNSISQNSEHFIPENFERNQMFIDLIADFMDSIESGKPSKTSLKKIIGGHKTALRIKDSLVSGKITTL
jgi:predicted dehydrogenase